MFPVKFIERYHLKDASDFEDCPRSLRPATLLKKRLWHRCFPVNFAKFSRTPFLQNTSGRLLLKSTYFINCLLIIDLHFQYSYVENNFILLFKDG